jgi:hypothetical protein
MAVLEHLHLQISSQLWGNSVSVDILLVVAVVEARQLLVLVVLAVVAPAVVPQLAQEVQVPRILDLVAVEPLTVPVLMSVELADLASSFLSMQK